MGSEARMMHKIVELHREDLQLQYDQTVLLHWLQIISLVITKNKTDNPHLDLDPGTEL